MSKVSRHSAAGRRHRAARSKLLGAADLDVCANIFPGMDRDQHFSSFRYDRAIEERHPDVGSHGDWLSHRYQQNGGPVSQTTGGNVPSPTALVFALHCE